MCGICNDMTNEQLRWRTLARDIGWRLSNVERQPLPTEAARPESSDPAKVLASGSAYASLVRRGG
jgi:hypothetical protein